MVFSTRDLGKLLFSRTGWPEVFFAGLLGGVLGFVPGFLAIPDVAGGFRETPGLIAVLLILALVLKVHLGMFGAVLAVAKLLSYLLLPVSHMLGALVVDPLTPFFGALRDTPFVAWCGPSHYATVGGLLIGTAFGGTCGALAWRFLQRVRTLIAGVADDQRVAAAMSNRVVRMVSWALLGGALDAKKLRTILDRKIRRFPRVRVVGSAVAAALAIGAFAVQSELASPHFHDGVQASLEHCNGATVDVAEAELDLVSGKARIDGLAITDPNDLGKNLFQVERLELDLDTIAITQRRLVIDRIVAREARTGVERDTPGERIATASPEAIPPEPRPNSTERTLEAWIREAETWKARLEQAAAWTGRIAGMRSQVGGSDGTPQADDLGTDPARVDRLGHVAARSQPIASRHPALLIRELYIDNIACGWLSDGDTLAVTGTNVSTHPARVDGHMELVIEAASGTFALTLGRGGGECGCLPSLDLRWRGLSVDGVMAALGLATPPLRGGTLDLQVYTVLSRDRDGALCVDAPLNIVAHGTTLVVPGAPPTAFDKLPLTLGLRGPLANPQVRVELDALKDTLIAAGRQQLAGLVQQHAAHLLGELPAAPLVETLVRDPNAAIEEARRQADEAKRKAEEETRRRVDEAKRKAEAEARMRAEAARLKAAEEAKKQLERRVPTPIKKLWPPR